MPVQQHSEWGGSVVARNVRCTGSVQACRTVPNDEDSEAAAEGRVAHALAEAAIRDDADVYELVGSGVQFNVAEEDQQADYRQPDLEMAEFIEDGYVRHVRGIIKKRGVQWAIEEDVDFSFAPENSGTIDLRAYDPKSKTLYITDLKYGRGQEVYADANEQLESYAIGALDKLDLWDEVKKVVLQIYQPRRDWYDVAITNTKKLKEREAYFASQYKISQGPRATLVPGMQQCRYCPAAAYCPALLKYTLAIIAGEVEQMKSLISDPMPIGDFEHTPVSDLATLIEQSSLVNKALDKGRARLIKEITENGAEDLPVKVVAGNGRRKWKDERKAEEKLKAMRIKYENIFKIEVISPAQAEKVVGPRQRKKLDDLITTSAGKPTLAPASDPRPALKPVIDDFDVVDELDLELELDLDGLEEDDDLGL